MEQNTMKNTIRTAKFGLGMLLAGALAHAEEPRVETQKTAFPVKTFVEYIQSNVSGNSFPRGNFLYTLPGDIKGYTFLEAYGGQAGAYAKTMLSRPITKNISLSNVTRSLNEGLTDTGFGLQSSYKSLDGTLSATGKILPVYFDSDAHRVHNKSVFSFLISKDLPHGWNASVYADINLRGKKGAEWIVGEAPVTKKLTQHLSAGYIPILRKAAPGKLVPKIEHRAELIWRF